MGVRRRIGAGDNRNGSCGSNCPYCTCAGGGDLKELLSEGVHSSTPPAGLRTYRGPALSLPELPRSHTVGSSVNRGTPLEGHAASRKSAIIPHHAIPLAGCDDCYGSHPNRTRRVPTNGAVAWLRARVTPYSPCCPSRERRLRLGRVWVNNLREPGWTLGCDVL